MFRNRASCVTTSIRNESQTYRNVQQHSTDKQTPLLDAVFLKYGSPLVAMLKEEEAHQLDQQPAFQATPCLGLENRTVFNDHFWVPEHSA